ncbi:CBS domain-containing protein [Salidesulfovibrio brasiliensis]|uniref:CBS domain-containing protein n=1 Tax=Salidesulfovibrio brasiliensis TaxID=221711 RepID=UPI001FDF2686|nr:CBS domain-containing protein [Salidesulfovibrio brasiliensis]
MEQLVVVDTRQKSRVPHVRPLLEKPGITIHTYDHHPDTDEDIKADKEVVLPWGSSAAILVNEMKNKGVEVGPEEATIIGLGIFEDTGGFSFSSTTHHDFEAAAWLRERGMDLEVIADILSRELSAEQISILGDLLNNATTHDIHGVEVVVTEVSTDTFVPDFAFLIHKMMDVEDIQVLFALGRMGDRIHMVARSRNPDVNVGLICSSLGGGGHAYAASATIKEKTLAEVRDDLFALFYSQINPQIVVKNLISSPPIVIEDDKPIDKAVELMTRFGLKGVPVVRAGTMECVGFIEQKIVDKASSHKLGHLAVSEYMASRFETVAPDVDLYTVMEIVLGKRQRMLPVVENGSLTGIITRTDLVNLLVEEPARIPESLHPERTRERNIESFMRHRMDRPIIDQLIHLGEIAEEGGFEVYVVGGFVRDILLDRPNQDIDLVVEGDGIAFARLLAKKLKGRVKAHRKFKTAVVLYGDDQRIDVATARLEYYQYPAALPTVELSSIKMDLFRRDFTINALALRLNPDRFANLVDFFGAERDIQNRRIRVLHSLSFVEDPTRILRAIRFEQRYDFEIGGQTMRLIKNALQLELFDKLSGSRITHELKLLSVEKHPAECFSRLSELRILEAIHPQLKMNTERGRTLAELERVYTWYSLLYLDRPADPWLLFFLGLTQGTKKDEAIDICKRLHFSPREEREVLMLRDLVGTCFMKLMGWQEGKSKLSEMFAVLDPMPVEGILFVMARSRKEHIRKNISQYLARLKDIEPDVSGQDLLKMGIPESPIMGQMLEAVRFAKIDGEVDTREQQIALVERMKRDFGDKLHER